MVRMMTGLSNLVVSYTPAVKLLLMIVLMIIGAGCIIPIEKHRHGQKMQFLMWHSVRELFIVHQLSQKK